MIENPFVVLAPEYITPEKFKEIFVKEHTWINALEIPKDCFINGVRGSGKSMLLNYLEFSHQLYYSGSLMNFLKKEREYKYIGIMVHGTLEKLETDRYELLIKNDFAKESLIQGLCMHDLIMAILHRIVSTFTDTKEMAGYMNNIKRKEVEQFCREELDRLDKRQVHRIDFNQQNKNTELLTSLANAFLKERENIEYYAYDKFQMKDNTYEGNFSSFPYLNSFLEKIKKLFDMADFSFYVLIDNGDEVRNTMQLCIDDLISQRQHMNVCFKVAVKKGIYWNKGDIELPHDFSQINIDEIYSTQHGVYYKRIQDIANRRLKSAGINVEIEKFLPESSDERKLLEKIKNELEIKYKDEYNKRFGEKPCEEHISESDYIRNRVSKYAQSELFRRLKKTEKSYAGFDNIVHLSSGIIRQFLDICSYMYDEEVKKKVDGKIIRIGLKTQRDVIRGYADGFIDELKDKHRALKREENYEEAKLYKGLYTLIEVLGKYYRKRLMNQGLREPRVFTFTLKDPDTDPEIEKILEIGVNGIGLTGNYFQTYWYSSKKGTGKYQGYAFNRRLCPRYRIDHTSFRGRIELSTADLRSAIEDRKIPKLVYDTEEERYVTLDDYTGGEQNG